jgi:predicted metal-dependent hydrolase
MALSVEVVRSTRRRKTVSAELIGDVVRVHVPQWMAADDVDRHVAELVPRLERRYRSGHIDLASRADQLADRFDLPRPAGVRWSEHQQRQWGSCTPDTGQIRLSSRLADMPSWVLDYVLVHELAHLVHADHSPAFRALVDRYPLAERARGFLMAKDDERAGEPDSRDDDAPGAFAPVARPERTRTRHHRRPPPPPGQLELGL